MTKRVFALVAILFTVAALALVTMPFGAATSPGGAVHAAAPAGPAQGGAQQAHRFPRESGPPSTGPAPLTGPPAPYKPLVIPNFGPNVRANTDTQTPNLAQQEPSIAVNPTNPLDVVAAAKDERAGSNTKMVWIYTSTDGGATWINQIFPFTGSVSLSSDPVVSFSDDGQCYVTALPYSGATGATGLQVAKSTDGGVTFSSGVHLPGSNSNSDKEWTWVDNFPSSPYYHRIYVAWMNFGAGNVIAFNYSIDRGASWSSLVSVGSASQFPMPVALPNGNVLVSYNTGGGAAYYRSTDGGATFAASQPISSITDPNCPPDNAGCGIWRLNAIPTNSVNPTNGTQVIVWSDGRTGTAAIYDSRSTDGGVTWSAAAPLAPPGVANTYQVEPWVVADEQGTFHAIWYDDRANPNTSIFNIDYSQSTDNGVTWSTAQVISTATSDLRIGIPSSYALAAGDYINVTASHGSVYGAWTDTRAGTGEDIYTVRGSIVQGTPTPTATGTPPTATRTSTPTMTPTASPTVNPCLLQNYVVATATGASIITGTLDTGNHCDDCSTQITLPFAYTLYGVPYTTANVVSNGHLDFGAADTTFTNACLPDVSTQAAIFPHWDDLRTDTGTGCSGYTGGCGVFSSVTGSAPNRIFNLEWRAVYFDTGAAVNFEVRLYESQNRFDIVYGTGSESGSGATVGVQNTTASLFTQFECNTGGLSSGLQLIFTLPSCGTATATVVVPTVTVAPPSATRTGVAPSATSTSVAPSATSTSAAPSATRTSAAATATNTSVAATATSTAGVPTATGTPCPISFSDVHPTDYFYTPVLYLACHGVISGYGDGTFRPFNTATRSQMVKIVVLGFNKPLVTPPGSNHTFADVTASNPFFAVVETAAAATIVSGYACGGPGEPCDAQHRPYFRPYANVTRGQFTKIVVVGKGWALVNPPNPHFADVPPGSAFYVFVETAYCHALVSGYACGGPGEPCQPLQLPYFRPNASGTRAQLAKVVYLAILSTSECVEPSPTPTP